MTPDERQMIIDLRDPPVADDGDWEMLDDVLQGDEVLGISHEGGELDALTEHVRETYVQLFLDVGLLLTLTFSRNHRQDNHTRRDRTERRQQLFQLQMESIIDAYMAWSHDAAHGATPDASPPDDGNTYLLTVIDVFGMYNFIYIYCPFSFPDPTASHAAILNVNTADDYLCSAFVRQGVIPSSPTTPSLGFSVQAVELFRTAHLRCPHFSQQAFIKTLSDLHSVRVDVPIVLLLTLIICSGPISKISHSPILHSL